MRLNVNVAKCTDKEMLNIMTFENQNRCNKFLILYWKRGDSLYCNKAKIRCKVGHKQPLRHSFLRQFIHLLKIWPALTHYIPRDFEFTDKRP